MLYLKDLRSRNWGDSISKYLHRKLSGKSPKLFPMTSDCPFPNYLMVGSVLRMCDERTVVWGSGFLSENDDLGSLSWGRSNNQLVRKPAKVLAVRGPLSRAKLIAMGVECPQVFGDPALLMPLYYRPKQTRSTTLGIIPHWTDWNTVKGWTRDTKVNIKIIDITFSRLAFTDHQKYLRLIDQICSCDYIFSGSLHGLILADAYKVPCKWVEFAGGRRSEVFKFLDYFESVGRKDETPVSLSTYHDIEKTLAEFKPYQVDINIDALLNCCPLTTL